MPYVVPEKKAKKKGKEAKSGLRRKGTSDVLKTPRRTPPLMKTKRRRKRAILPLRGERRKGGLPRIWRRRRPRKGESPLRMTPNRTPMSGAPGRSPRPDRKYPKALVYIYISGFPLCDFNTLNYVL